MFPEEYIKPTDNQQSHECAQRGRLRPAGQQQLPTKQATIRKAAAEKEQKPVLAVSASVNTLPLGKTAGLVLTAVRTGRTGPRGLERIAEAMEQQS